MTRRLEIGYDSRNVQEPHPHRDVNAMHYTHVLSRGRACVRGPADLLANAGVPEAIDAAWLLDNAGVGRGERSRVRE